MFFRYYFNPRISASQENQPPDIWVYLENQPKEYCFPAQKNGLNSHQQLVNGEIIDDSIAYLNKQKNPLQISLTQDVFGDGYGICHKLEKDVKLYKKTPQYFRDMPIDELFKKIKEMLQIKLWSNVRHELQYSYLFGGWYSFMQYQGSLSNNGQYSNIEDNDTIISDNSNDILQLGLFAYIVELIEKICNNDNSSQNNNSEETFNVTDQQRQNIDKLLIYLNVCYYECRKLYNGCYAFNLIKFIMEFLESIRRNDKFKNSAIRNNIFKIKRIFSVTLIFAPFEQQRDSSLIINFTNSLNDVIKQANSPESTPDYKPFERMLYIPINDLFLTTQQILIKIDNLIHIYQQLDQEDVVKSNLELKCIFIYGLSNKTQRVFGLIEYIAILCYRLLNIGCYSIYENSNFDISQSWLIPDLNSMLIQMQKIFTKKNDNHLLNMMQIIIQIVQQKQNKDTQNTKDINTEKLLHTLRIANVSKNLNLNDTIVEIINLLHCKNENLTKETLNTFSKSVVRLEGQYDSQLKKKIKQQFPQDQKNHETKNEFIQNIILKIKKNYKAGIITISLFALFYGAYLTIESCWTYMKNNAYKL
jgi:hypothetical protein